MSLSKIGKSVFKTTLLIAIATVAMHAPGTAAPVEYVKVCNAYGQGFFNIPGTDTCTRVSVGGQVGFGGADTRFDVNPGFDVSGSGVAFGANGMVLFGLASSGLAVGPRLQYFGGNMKGSSYYPFSGGTYDVSTKSILTGDLVMQYAPSSWRGASVRGFVGIADTRRETAYNVVRTSAAALVGSDTSSNVGITAGIGANVPIPSGFTGVSLTGELRYVGGTANYNIPGSVGTHHDSFLGTLGLEYSFTAK
jgi:Porin subfamily